MKANLRIRFWVEASIAAVGAFLFVLTIAWRDWIEGVFGVDPDHHNGSLEWLIVAFFLITSITLGALARAEWHRSKPTPTSHQLRIDT